MLDNVLILTGDSNMTLSGDHAIHFPYTLVSALNKFGVNAQMSGLEDAAYLNSYGISSSKPKAIMIPKLRKVMYIRKLRKVNIYLYKLAIGKIIRKYKPGIVLAINIFPIREVFKEIRKYSRLVFWSVDDPRFLSKEWFDGASEADFVLTNSYGSVKDYKEIGISKVEFLPPAFDPRFFKKLNMKKDIDILYVGTIKGRDLGYEEILKPIIEKFRKRLVLVGWDLDEKPLGEAKILPPVRWFELTYLFNRAKIVLNIHVDKNREREGTFNYRDFETPGSGAFVVSDNIKKMELCFEPKRELIMMNDSKEITEILEYYLNNEEEREKIAFRGYERANKDHTVNKRAKFLIDIFNKFNI